MKFTIWKYEVGVTWSDLLDDSNNRQPFIWVRNAEEPDELQDDIVQITLPWIDVKILPLHIYTPKGD
jgi:hypothetical protein